METMQSILEKDKEKFLQLLNSEDDAERAAAQVNRELSRILYVFNEQDESDAVKKAAMQMITAVQASASLLDSAGATDVYHRTQQETNSNGHLPARFWIYVMLTVACGGGAVAMYILKGNPVSSVIELPLILAMLVLMIFFTFLSGRSAHKVTARPKEEYLTKTTFDAMKIYRSLFTTVVAIDRQLQDVRMDTAMAEKKQRIETRGNLSDAELDLLSSLLETALAEEGDGAKQTVSEISYYLHRKGAEVVHYSADHKPWFDMMPSGGGSGAIRPAIVMDGNVLRKGLAAGGQ